MNGIRLALVAAALSPGAVSARGGLDADRDRSAIRQAALDYAEGFYEGSVERMARAVHPALLKRGLLPPGVPDRFLQLMNAETLIDLTDAGRGRPAADRHLDFALLDLRDEVASARIFTDEFNDYLHLAKQDERWRIVSVLWQVPASAGSERDKAAVARVIGEYYEGLYACSAARVRRGRPPRAGAAHPASGSAGPAPPGRFERRPPAGRPAARAGGEDDTVQVLEVHDRIASARVTQGSRGSYIHLAKQNGQWRLVNMLSW